MTATTYTSVDQRTNVYAEVKMLEYAEPILVLEKFADTKPLPKNKADTIEFRRPIPFPVEPSELTEGVTPAAHQMEYEDVSVQMQQYGDLVEVSDKVNDLSEDPVLNDAARLAGEQAAEVRERICWGAFRAGTNVTYLPTATATNRATVQGAITLNAQRGIVRSLNNQRGKMISEVVSASPKYATEPVAPSFIAVGHTDLEQDIRELPGFVPCEKYGEQTKKLHDMELGKVENVRYVLSPVLIPFAGAGAANTSFLRTGGNVDVYPILYMARHAVGTVPLKGAGSMNPTIINPGQLDKSDPLGQRGIVGWKMYFAALILNEAWINRVECGATDLS